MELKSHPNKKLIVHLKGVGEKCREKISGKELNLSLIEKDKLAQIAYIIGICHDFGKSTSFFQRYLLEGVKSTFSHHGIISAIFGFCAVKEISDNELFPICAYATIKRHHGNIEKPDVKIDNVKNDLKKQIADIKEEKRMSEIEEMYSILFKEMDISFNKILDETAKIISETGGIFNFFESYYCDNLDDDLNIVDEDKGIESYLIMNLLYSVLIDSDKKDAAGIDDSYYDKSCEKIANVKGFIEKLRNDDPEKFSFDNPVNKLRTDFFNEVVTNKEIKKENKIYKLTAPTGIGKTFTAFGFANELREFLGERRIIYCLPFTTVIEQNFYELENILRFSIEDFDEKPNKYLLMHHHLSDMEIKEYEIKNDSKTSKNIMNYYDSKLVSESWECGNITTTFVQLFHSIIGNKNSFLKKYHNIVNSIIILDEIQNLPPKYLKLIGKVYQILAEKFNTYFLFLTATQPEIAFKNSIVLADEERYSMNDYFNRVEMFISPKAELLKIEDFISFFSTRFGGENALIICNTVASAIEIYNRIKIHVNGKFKIFSLTTNLTPEDRAKRIKIIKDSLKDKEKIIVVSTQLVEAGVDFSFKEVYRDFAPLASIIQSAGRGNRNGELLPEKAKVYIFRLIKENGKKYSDSVYNNSLLNLTDEILKEQKYEAKEFSKLSQEYFKGFDFNRESSRLIYAVCTLNYSENEDSSDPVRSFKLIEENQKRDIVICTTKDTEAWIEEMKILYTQLKEKTIELNTAFERIEKIKKILGKYTVSVYEYQLKQYEDIIENTRDNGSGLEYINYKNQLEYVYSEEIGFLEEPKKTIINAIMI